MKLEMYKKISLNEMYTYSCGEGSLNTVLSGYHRGKPIFIGRTLTDGDNSFGRSSDNFAKEAFSKLSW